MDKAHNIIVLENFLLKYVRPHTLEQRGEIAREIIDMFAQKDDNWFRRFADTFPDNVEGRNTDLIINELTHMRKQSPYIFHDYLQAVSSAHHMLTTIKQLPPEAFQLFTSILIMNPRVKDVNAAFDLRNGNAPLSQIANYMMTPGRVPPKNINGGMVTGFVQGLENKFPHEPAMKGRFYLRTILSQVQPEDAHQICRSCFMNQNANPHIDAESILTHHSMRWAAMVVDPKRRKLMNLQSVPLPPSNYSRMDTYRGRNLNIVSELCNGAIVVSLAFGIATGILSKNPPTGSQVYQTIEKWLKPGP